MKKLVFIAVIISVVFTSCSSEFKGHKEFEDGHFMKLLSFSEDSQKVGNNTLVQFNWTVSNLENKKLYSERLFLRVDSTNNKKGLLTCLQKLKQGEKASFIFSEEHLESEFKSTLEETVISDKQLLKHTLSIDKIYTEKEFEKEKKKFLDWIGKLAPVNFNSIENQIIDNYTENLELEMVISETGLRRKIFPSNSGVKTGFGKHVTIKYKGGELAKPSRHIETEQDFYIGQELQVIPALEEALLYMEQGDSAIIIAPSNLAFGDKGSSTGYIPGSSPVQYNIVLVNCD